MFSRLLVVFEGPGGFEQLRETCRIDFHHSSHLADFMVPSCKEKTLRVNFLNFSNSFFLTWLKDLDILGCKFEIHVKFHVYSRLEMSGA